MLVREYRLIYLDISNEKASNVYFYECDITSPKAIAAAASKIRADVGEPTVLINNAGIARGKSILDSSENDIRSTFDVNALAHYWLLHEFLPYMVKCNYVLVVSVALVFAFV